MLQFALLIDNCFYRKYFSATLLLTDCNFVFVTSQCFLSVPRNVTLPENKNEDDSDDAWQDTSGQNCHYFLKRMEKC